MATPAGSSRYAIQETISRQQDVTIYRVVDIEEGKSVLLKVLTSRHDPRDLQRLKREHEIGCSLDATPILRPLALTTFEGLPALACADSGAQPLDRTIGAPMDVARFLELAMRIVSAVGALHRERAVHKNLKPENIYVHPVTDDVELTGLGLASRLPREILAVQPSRLIEGSLPYLSPEQTGRTARFIDSRSDLYSLGVIFYQMLTGRLPFEAADAFEWIYCHVARAPPSLAATVPTLPLPLVGIVEKLLAKDPEDRYQTTSGLLHDVEHCAAAWRRNRSIEPFALGERDVTDELRAPERLYGRERETRTLLDAFHDVASNGVVELLLIRGGPGVGKSALVGELREPVLEEGALFLSGKFDQHAPNVPYSTLVQAFTRLILDLLAQDEEERSAWREPLRRALGIEARLIVDVIPPLRTFLGDPPPLVEAPLLDAEQRFRRVFLDFLGVFTRPRRPLILFLDDLQWADAASLRLLEEIVTAPEARDLLLLGAYRDNEVSTTHPLAQMLERVRGSGAHLREVALEPLGGDEVCALVSDTLHATRESARPLAESVSAKTGGNPFFVLQFLNLIHQERLVWLDEATLSWHWDISAIEARGYTQNVIDFMLQRLKSLPVPAQHALTTAACVGSQGELSILALAYGKSEQETCDDLSEAIEHALVVVTPGSFAFAHDRVQHAAYEVLQPARREHVHLQIGRLLSEQTPADRIEERLFDIVGQLNRGLRFVDDEAERLRIAELNLQAGRKARSASAHDLAVHYLATGQALLPEDAWERHYELTYGLHLERARCEALSQNFESAFRLVAELRQRARTAADQLEVVALQIDLVVVQPQSIDENVLLAIDACAKWLGVRLTPHPSESELVEAVEEALGALGGRSIEDVASLQGMCDPAVKAGVEVLSKAMPAAYYIDLRLHDLMSATIVNLSLRYGNSACSPHGYSTFGGAVGRLFERWDEARRFGQVAVTIAEQDPVPSPGKGSSYFTNGVFIDGWTLPVAEVVPVLRRAFEAARRCSDINVASFASLAIVEYRFAAGDSLTDVASEAERQLEYTRHVRQYIHDYVDAMLLLVRRLRGDTALAPRISGVPEAAAIPSSSASQHPWLRFQHQACRAIEHFVFGDFRSAAMVAQSYRTLAHMGSAADVALAWYIAALAYACYIDDAPADERLELRRWLADLEEHHRVWERRCAATFRNRRALISAEVARLEGRDAEATRLYEEAIAAARQGGFVQNEAIAAELAARFCRLRGLSTAAEGYLRRARACYQRWGADAKVVQLDTAYASLRPAEVLGPTATQTVRPEYLDMLSVLKAAQTISSEIEFDTLVHTLLGVVLMQSGAQRAVLVLDRSGTLFVEAHAELTPSGLSTSTLRQELSDAVRQLPVALLRYVAETGQRLIVDDDVRSAPVADEYLLRTQPRSVLCLPILKQGKVLGLFLLENRLLAGTFTPGRLAAVEVLATQSAISVENALLLAAEREARAAAEAAERRAALLSEASARLSESLDHSAQIAWLTRFCASSIADWCVIDVLEGERVAAAVGAHREASKEAVLRALLHQYPTRLGSRQPSANVLTTGEPLLMERISPADLRSSCVNDQHARLMDTVGSKSAVIAPLLARGQVLGALSMGSAVPGRFTRADLGFVQDLARRAAMAMENARLYRESREEVRLRKQLEDQLVQAQKMESVGRLAGGVAHDFNNLLTVISVGVELGETELPPDHPARPHLAVVTEAAASAASLTRQLLAFSRKQVITPRDLDLNDIIRRVEKMILRVLGEDIALETACAPTPSWIHADPGQVEQIVMNLAINARDAMPDGGRLTISTTNVQLDEAYSRLHVDARPGAYVLLEVSDTGVGIPEDVRDHLFEPFFTTKEAGKGTGLGLSMVYGAVRQNGGHIEVESQVARGATFRVYLPAAARVSNSRPARRAAPARPRLASILLVEDDEAVRRVAADVLERMGHTVHAFMNGDDALAALSKLRPRPELLITDVILPGMSGRVLVERVAEGLPNIRVLFVSGYPQDVVLPHGAWQKGVELLAKPFSIESLTRRVRDVLGDAPSSMTAEA